jgi:hypothetical protein
MGDEMERANSIAQAAFFWIGALTLIFGPALAYWLTKDTMLATLVLFGAAAAVFVGRFESFVEFAFGPLKAKMRQTIAEANATLDQLREIAVMSASAALTDIMAGGFSGSMSQARRLDVHDDIVASLQRIGVSEDTMRRVKKEWDKGIEFIYSRGIGEMVFSELEQPQRAEVARAWSELGDFSEWRAPTPQQIEKLCERFSHKLSAQVAAALDDYRHFLRTGEIREREKFVRY